MSRHAPKRNDIQGLRAIAIFGVLLFHLAPKRFTNGFLGVDTFFVLSGYLMCSILSRESTLTANVVKTFYVRRFKRIAPLYTLMLAILALIVPFIFLPSDMPHFITDMEWALPFAENMQNVMKQFDYWDEVFNSPVLLHAWSLGVEIQYYLIVPFIMIVARFGQTRRYRMIAFLAFMGASYSLHFYSSSTISFGLLFARVWQFLTGSIFYELEGALDEPKSAQDTVDQEKLLENSEDGLDEVKIDKPPTKPRSIHWLLLCSFPPLITPTSYFVTILLVWMSIVAETGATESRVLVTFATGVLLLIGKYSQNRILSNALSVYVGDLSYLVYLAHWPVIILYKYYYDVSDLILLDMFLCLLATFIISVLLHHSLESFFISASTTVAVIFVGVIYSAIGVAIILGSMQHLSEYAHRMDDGGVLGSINRTEAIEWNAQQSKVTYFPNPADCVRDLEAEGWTGVRDERALRCISKGNGTAKVLLIGNSYGYRAFPVLHRLFDGRYAQLRMYTKSSRVYLTRDPKSTRFSDTERIVVEKFQPDITFLIEKDTFKTLLKPMEGSVEEDPITKYLKNAVDFLSNNSGTVVIDRQYAKPSFTDGVAYMIQKRLTMGKTKFDDLGISRKDYEAEYANEIARMDTIKNSNVILNNVEDQLCPSAPGNFCYFYNRDNLHAYYGDLAVHLTPEGLNLLEPHYKNIIEDFLLRLHTKTTTIKN